MSCFGVCSFSRPRELNTLLADDWSGQLAISRQLGAEPPDDADPMTRLELELKAGLSDRDHDRVLDSIRMLGNLRHLQSNAELISLLDSPDELVQTYVFEAMLRLHDYSVSSAVEPWLVDSLNLLLISLCQGMRCSRCRIGWPVRFPRFAILLHSQSFFACLGSPSRSYAKKPCGLCEPLTRQRARRRFWTC